MKVIQNNYFKLIGAGTLKTPSLTKNDGAIDPKQMLFPQKNAADFFSKWTSYCLRFT